VSVPPFVRLPPGVRRVEIETARGTFAALETASGPGVPERRPALLVPGFTGSKEDFIAVLPALTVDGRRVIAVDQRGQFETSGPDDPGAYTCAELGADIAALAEIIDPAGVHLVGHSFGGLVAREAVLADPARMASLTLMGSGPAAIGEPSASRARALIDALREIELKRIWDTFIEPEAVAEGLQAEIIGFLRERMLRNAPAGLIGMGGELVTAPDQVDRLAKVIDDAGIPALVLFGENDDAWDPPVQAAMAERLNACKVVIAGAAHSPASEAPAMTSDALSDFWDDAEHAPPTPR
jgi:pimeloyl-ACP methyl ester carboxylesterase